MDSRRSAIPASYAASFAWTAVAPAVFVVLWSSGFLGGKAEHRQ
jgi:hypothetical protein